MAKKKAAAQKAAAPVTVDDWGATAAAPAKKKKGGGGLMKVGGVVVAAVAVIMALGGGGANPLVDLDVNDEAALRKVFFGGEVWAVACQDGRKPLADSVEAVAHRLNKEMNFGVVDCKTQLPGKSYTLTQRWKLKKQHADDPVVFLSNGVSVEQIGAQYFRSEYDLIRELRLLALRRPFMAKNTELLREKCWSKARCLLVLQGGTLEAPVEKALHALAGHHARGGKGRTGQSAEDQSSVVFVSMDAAEHRLPFEGYDLGDAIKLRSFEAGNHRAIYFRNVTGSATLKALAHKGALTTEALGKFLGTVSLDSDETPYAKLVDIKKDINSLGIYRRSKKTKAKKATIKGGKDFTEDAKKAAEEQKKKKPETAEELKAAFKEQQKREQEKRARMDAESDDLFEEVDGEEEVVEEEEEDEEEEMI